MNLPTLTRYDLTHANGNAAIDSFGTVEEAAAALAERMTDSGYDAFAVRRVEVECSIRYLRPDDSDRVRLRRAFKALGRTHVTSMGRVCCSSCMWAELPDDRTKGFVGFNRQSWSDFDRDESTLIDTLWLQHDGDSERVVEVLRRHGLAASWSGSESDAIRVDVTSARVCPEDHDDRWCRNCRASDRLRERYEREQQREAVPA